MTSDVLTGRGDPRMQYAAARGERRAVVSQERCETVIPGATYKIWWAGGTEESEVAGRTYPAGLVARMSVTGFSLADLVCCERLTLRISRERPACWLLRRASGERLV